MTDLETLFKLQSELGKKIQKKESKSPSLSDLCVALMHESAELHDCVSWKWWKHNEQDINQHIYEELADVLHFVLAIALKLNMTPQQLFNDYHTKNLINRRRQDDGY